MSCAHCCFSCGKHGKHGDYDVILEGLAFTRDTIGNEFITIGGGEPTLHPRFFDILKHTLENFESIWMATNGSRTEIMDRLVNIIDGEDYPECDCIELYGEEEYEEYGCRCHEKYDDDSIYQEDKLTIALSLDPWHDAIDESIKTLWLKRSNSNYSHFEINDVSVRGAAAQGRAKRTQNGYLDHCVCADIMMLPNGKLKMCGCTASPIIGDIRNGIGDYWEEILQSNAYRDENCYRKINKELTRKGKSCLI